MVVVVVGGVIPGMVGAGFAVIEAYSWGVGEDMNSSAVNAVMARLVLHLVNWGLFDLEGSHSFLISQGEW